MRLSTIGAQAFVTGFSGAAMPGPVLAAAIVLAASRGFWAGPLIVVGHGLLEVPLALALAAGLGRHLASPRAPLVRAIGLVGGVVLLLMAADMLRSAPQLSLATTTAGGQRDPVVAGLVLSAANPYFWIWWATIGLGLLTEAGARRGRAGMAVCYTGHILSDFAWYGLVTALVAGGGRLLSDPVYRGLVVALALLLVVFGVKFVRFALHPPAETPTDAP